MSSPCDPSDEKHEHLEPVPCKRKFIKPERFKAMMAKRNNFLPMRAVAAMVGAPVSATLEAYCPKPYDQGALGSCTANAICHVLKMIDPQRGQPGAFEPSRLFIYTEELRMERPNQPIQDLGANAADGCAIINAIGVCPEADMPYLMDPVTKKVSNFGQYPSAQAYSNARLHKYPMFSNVTNNGPMLQTIQTLINQNEPVLLAFLVYPSFTGAEVLKTGQMTMPSASDLAAGIVGGHQVVVVGYDAQNLRILNSWGADWGQKGYFNMPISYLTGSAKDGPFVMQLLTLAPIPNAPAPGPAPPGPTPPGPTPPGPSPGPGPINGVMQIRAQIAFLTQQLAVLDAQLRSLPQ